MTPHSVVIIARQALWDQIREFWQSQGYELGDGVPLSASGEEPFTHRGAHMWLTADQAQLFTLRQNPSSYANGYTFGQATACMAQFQARDNGANVNHGAVPDVARDGRLSIDFLSGEENLTKRTHFDQLLSDNNLAEYSGSGELLSLQSRSAVGP